MTTSSPAQPTAARDQFDTGPLSWVIGEIREALNRSKSALHDAVSQDADAQPTSLRLAKTYLHQAHGALQIVDVDGIAIITETVEDLLDRVDIGQVAMTMELAVAIGGSYQALVEYLDELLSGVPHQPVRLFPYYRTLLEARGAERIHPADLFFPNLAIRPQLPPIEEGRAARPSKFMVMRQHFEKALLPFLRSSDRGTELANAAAMRDIIGEIERVQSSQQARAFWWVLHGLADEVAAGHIPNEIYVKQLFARINLQIRRLSQGSPSIAERLLRDALFFIARAADPSSRAKQIRQVYQLDGLVPADYDTRRYGQLDVDALAVAKERLSQAKNIWNRIAGGDASFADSFEHEMHMLADAGTRLNSAPLSKLLRELKGIARHAAHAKAGDTLGLEVATSLLFVENALASITRLPENFAERADAMTTRLLAVVSGETPEHSAPWLDDMSREAQQRQTMTALAGEMQSSLRQVEKMLDEYFRDPTQRTALGQLDGILHQIEGAMAVLDQDDAMRTIQHTRAAVSRFINAEDEETPEHGEFQKVAQNVGALSFFIESLQLPTGAAAKRFTFDDDTGTFHAHLIEKDAQADAALDVTVDDAGDWPAEQETSASPLPTVEDELAFHQQQSAELAMSLSVEPDNQVLQEQLKESLEKIRLDATLIDNPELNDRARAGIDILKRQDFSESSEALAQIITATVPAVQVAESLPPVVAPETDEAIDAELLEIFLSEAEEVLGAVRQTLPESRMQPHNQEHLTTLRRCFHTLKGSSRMVGLVAFGEAAWSIEQVLNLRLSESRNGDAELYALLEKAAEVLGDWVQGLKSTGTSSRTPDALVRAAECVKAGGQFSYEDDAAPDVDAVVLEQQTPELIAPLSLPDTQIQVGQLPDDGEAGDDATSFMAEPAEAGGSEALLTDTDEVPLVAGDGENGLDEVIATLPQAEELRPGDDDFAMFEPAQPASPNDALDVSSAPQPQPQPLIEPVIQIADVIEFPTLQPAEPRRDDNVKRIGDIEISVPLHNIYLAETDELVRLLAQDFSEWRHEPERQVDIHAVHAAHSLAGSSATVGFKALQEVAHALELFLQSLSRRPARLEVHEFDVLEQSIERIKLMLQKFALGEMPVFQPEFVRILAALRQDVEMRAEEQSHPHTETSVANEFEAAPFPGIDASIASESVELPPLEPTPLEPHFELALEPESAPVESTVTDAESVQDFSATESEKAVAFPEPVSEGNAEAAIDPALVLKDELDSDLMPVFLEEGRDILPQMASVLRGWQEAPAEASAPQSLLRSLHTLKGSARMAGAMSLGQHLHDMETRVENIMHLGSPSPLAIEDLLVRYDQALQMFEHLQNPQAAQQVASEVAPGADPVHGNEASAQPVILSPLAPLPEQTPLVPMTPQAGPLAKPAGSVPMVRVRADILDRLVNQAGEVSISRSKLETEVGTLKQSLTELTENVTRLRDQLREIEMQAETQIASRMGHAGEREFDPLEFDRFTRLQELTRMMAESVNDVGSVHQNLNRTLESAVTDLTLQARLTRDLQQDLMRVRMVQFASISERLFRVTRQVAKEVDKRVNLDIRGSAVEIDRGVLERMTGPFEHLLRNAIVHGIESREARRAAGKSDIGELLVEIRQEGNEVVIQFSDDGQGLNIGRIREKAKRIGLLTNDSETPDEDVTDMIFHPGFSTADEITELAGRGVGMDVVRSEAAALGGRVSIRSEAGKGTHFTIQLPLTLAVTQVVLLSTGGRTYAVPSVLVEQVQQLKTNALASAYNDGAVVWQGQRVPMYYLSTLLGDTLASPVSQQYSPLLILRSGNERVAVHVDEVIGNREVVVKNIGPQLARLIGVAGATVLGSGDIVLILNPVPLAQRAAQENIRAPRIMPSDAPDSMGAVAEIAPRDPEVPASPPVQGLRMQDIVMVVDDSLTVRRVTQRLLAREGYQVVLAKDGVDALEQLQSVTPSVMLVDIEMPRMDGFDLTRNVRDDERTRHIPIIMITSRTAAKHRNYAMEIGVNEYLGKPYQEDQLLKLIAGFVGREVRVN